MVPLGTTTHRFEPATQAKGGAFVGSQLGSKGVALGQADVELLGDLRGSGSGAQRSVLGVGNHEFSSARIKEAIMPATSFAGHPAPSLTSWMRETS